MKSRGHITLTFDDGYEHILKDIVPLLDQHQIPGVFAIPIHGQSIQKETGHKVSSVQDWQSINPRHEIAAHSLTHCNLTACPTPQQIKEIKEPKEILGATTLVYPGGAFNAVVLDAVKKYYSAARTTQKGFEKIPPNNPYQLKTHNWTQQNFSPIKANALALFAYLTNAWLIETYHIISNDDKTNSHAIPLKDFQKHLNFITKLPIQPTTIREAIST